MAQWFGKLQLITAPFLNILSVGLDFKDSFGPGQNLPYLFSPLTPLNISKGVDVIGGWIFILWWTMSDGHDEWVKPIGLSRNLPFLQIELVTVWATVCISPKNITKIMTDALIWIIHSPTFSNFIHFQAHFVPFLPWLYFADIFQILETLSWCHKAWAKSE